MMKKNAIALAVAGLCTAGVAQAETGHWEVVTPSSPNEAAPHLAFSRSHLGNTPGVAATQPDAPVAVAEVVTPLSVDESAPWLTTQDKLRQHRAATRTRLASLPNPQTPWSPNESGANRYTEDMQAYRQHVASVEQTRNATIAANQAAEAAAVAAAKAAAEAAAVASAQPAPADPTTTAELDRLLKNPSSTPGERDREAVATANPALVDSRQSASTALRPETVPPASPAPEAAASGLPAPETAGSSVPAPEAAASSVAAGSARPLDAAIAPAPIGASTVAAASSSVAGSTADVSVTPAASPEAPVAAGAAPAASTTAPQRDLPAQTQGSAPAQ